MLCRLFQRWTTVWTMINYGTFSTVDYIHVSDINVFVFALEYKTSLDKIRHYIHTKYLVINKKKALVRFLTDCLRKYVILLKSTKGEAKATNIRRVYLFNSRVIIFLYFWFYRNIKRNQKCISESENIYKGLTMSMCWIIYIIYT